MKRIVLAAITCLSLLVAVPAVSAAHASGQRAGRDHRPDDRGGHRDRLGDRHRDPDRRDRLEHVRSRPAGTAASLVSFRNGVLTIKPAGGPTVSGLVTGETRVSCEANDQDFASHDGGSGSGDHGDQHNDPSCLAMLHQPGTAVQSAELQVSSGPAVWTEVELGR